MSSTPFTLIEGAYALPRLRPFEHLPESFGRDWATLAPSHSWRTELESLYAALLRTACIRNEDIFARCKWQPLDVQHAAAPAARDAQPAVIANVNTIRGDVPRPNTQLPMRIQLKVRPSRKARRRASRHWSVMAGAACIAGGGALLVWMALGQHLTPRQIASELLRPVNVTMARRDAQLEKDRPRDGVAARQAPVVGNTNVQIPPRQTVAAGKADGPVSPAAPVQPASGSTPAPVAAAAQETATQSEPTRSGNPLATVHAHPRGVLRPKAHPHPRDVLHPKAHRKPEYGGASYLTSPAHGKPRVAHTRAAPIVSLRLHAHPAARADALPTQARAQAQPRFTNNEYTAVMTSAATYVRDIASLPRPAASTDPSAGSGTAWMNHISQRRVTEIPEQFAK
ncbi:hypothetical protein [Paraburkholderia susongensis]|uniref:Uncharacterized protein n=1 Tax=Paraburkholderia susongensis TaxID=1515439 RepID=A0A1X7IP93_9BURK|nr:hypothetical protein [Paraburkholderia susongensis]SMG16570.1 hypothetical protein SAMN06265784_101890 [Paraburkholderia susongensis]